MQPKLGWKRNVWLGILAFYEKKSGFLELFCLAPIRDPGGNADG